MSLIAQSIWWLTQTRSPEDAFPTVLKLESTDSEPMLTTRRKYVLKYAPINLGLTLKILPESVCSDVLQTSTDKTIHVNASRTALSGARSLMTWQLSVWVNALRTPLPTTGQWDAWRNAQQVHMPTTQHGDALLNAPKTQLYTLTRQNTCAS